MPSFKITIDDECAEHLEGQRAKIQDNLIELSTLEEPPPPPWFAGFMENVGSYILYLAIDHCRNIERNRVNEEKMKEGKAAIAAVDAHITTITGSAEEIS